jgi:hypothetical protein
MKLPNILNRKKYPADTPTGKKLPLIHFHTFKTGEKIYTYKPDDFGKISSRYWKAIQLEFNHLTMFNLNMNDWNSSVTKIQTMCLDGVSNKINPGQALMDIYSIMEFQKAIPLNKIAVQYSHQKILYCMFFVLEGEIEMGYNEKHNDEKIRLLEAEPDEVRDAFFTQVRTISENLEINLQADIPQMLAATLKLLETKPNTL